MEEMRIPSPTGVLDPPLPATGRSGWCRRPRRSTVRSADGHRNPL